MADPSTTYVQMSLFDSDGATSLPGLADGIMPSDSPGGPKTGRCGRGAVRANHTPQQESGRGTRTSGTCGRNSSGSSASAALTQSLANKCRELLGSAGSMEYRQTWKQKATPSGRLYWAHTASVPRTSDSDCFGLPTPQTHDCRGGKTPEQVEAMREKTGAGVSNLNEVCYLMGWPTPVKSSGDGGRVSSDPAAKVRPSGCRKQLTINDAAQLVGMTLPSSPAETKNRGVLNPALALWLMGYPSSWLTAQAERVVCPAPNSSGDSATP